MPSPLNSPWRNAAVVERMNVLLGNVCRSMSEIAAILNREFPQYYFTRNAVIGRATRQKLVSPNRAAFRGNNSRVDRGGSVIPRARRERPEGAAPRVGELATNTLVANGFVRKLNRSDVESKATEATDLPQEAMPETSKPLLEAEQGDCRWPMADDGHTAMCCGAPTVGPRYSYCLHHASISYTKAQKVRDDSYVRPRPRRLGKINGFA